MLSFWLRGKLRPYHKHDMLSIVAQKQCFLVHLPEVSEA